MRRRGREVLDRVTLTAPAGSITALVGRSGAGKTTLLDVVAGLVPVEVGEIRVGGVALAALDMRAWRSGIGYVPQDDRLLDDSIAANVACGEPAAAERVERALEAAAAADIARVRGGAGAPIGERGDLLSGGERRRVALARALAREPHVLLLDEATAELDARTAAEVARAIDGLRGRATIVLATHHGPLAAIADRVYEVADGRVREVSADGAERRVAAIEAAAAEAREAVTNGGGRAAAVAAEADAAAAGGG